MYANSTKADRIEAYYGSNDWTRGEMLRVTRIIPHPKHYKGGRPNDIAIFVVEKPFKYGTNARPICIPTAPVNILGTDNIVAGWGYLKEGGPPTKYLQYTTIRVLPNNMCSAAYPTKYDSRVMFCAYRMGTDSCQGDSGGPAMSRDVRGRYLQVGIVSFGRGCARKNIPGVYARVDVFAPWLTKVVGSFDQLYSIKVSLPLQPHTISPPIIQFL
uniref:Secreted serine protease n=1 Tax=Rhipicephalus zambeziensis TaxID=60191 RepID=A0A224YEN1_9ACAR